jgi:hypothetical protein
MTTTHYGRWPRRWIYKMARFDKIRPVKDQLTKRNEKDEISPLINDIEHLLSKEDTEWTMAEIKPLLTRALRLLSKLDR